jgi:hypothetical protein
MRNLSMAGRPSKLEYDVSIMIQPKPIHPIENRIYRSIARTGAISILNPQQKAAAMVPRIKPIEKSGPRTTDMEITGWRWGETSNDLGILYTCAHALYLQSCQNDGGP